MSLSSWSALPQPKSHWRQRARAAMREVVEAAAHRKRPADWAREQVWRICAAAGVPDDVTPQGLRGTMSTLAHEAGDSPGRVAASLGHTLEVNRRSYTDQDRAEAAQRERALQVIQGGKR